MTARCEVCDREYDRRSGWWKYALPGRSIRWWCPDHADHRPFVREGLETNQ